MTEKYPILTPLDLWNFFRDSIDGNKQIIDKNGKVPRKKLLGILNRYAWKPGKIEDVRPKKLSRGI